MQGVRDTPSEVLHERHVDASAADSTRTLLVRQMEEPEAPAEEDPLAEFLHDQFGECSTPSLAQNLTLLRHLYAIFACTSREGKGATCNMQGAACKTGGQCAS